MFAYKPLCRNVDYVYQNMGSTAESVYQNVSRFPKFNIITSTIGLRNL